MFKYIILVFIVFFTACSTNNIEPKKDTLDKKNFTSREYKGISKDAIFEAAKKVFILASKKEFRIDSYRNQLIVSKTKMSHFPFYPVTSEDRWTLFIEEKDNISFAKLDLVRITDFDEEVPNYLGKSHHELFWSRVDYLLGLSDEWFICNGFSDYRGALCDGLEMYDNKNATKDDIIKDILIVNRNKMKEFTQIDDDILNEDVEFALDETNDTLEKDKTLDENLDKEIEELDRKVNKNIDETLDKIENNIEDEIIEDENK